MNVEGWRYYNHAAIPTTPPHEDPDITPVLDGKVWDKGVYLARWTTNFDCKEQTNWWHVIKDTPYDTTDLKAKRRYEINRGKKFFDVVQINPQQYKEELYEVQIQAFAAYPKKYRPTTDRASFMASINKWSTYYVFGVFDRESNELCGYAALYKKNEKCVDFRVLKTKPIHEKRSVNAALVDGVMNFFNDFLSNGGYITDGERSISHETAFQDYLEKYFGFRKAYCNLHIEYNPRYSWVVKLLYRFRWLFSKLDGIGIIHQLNSLMCIENIVRGEDAR